MCDEIEGVVSRLPGIHNPRGFVFPSHTLMKGPERMVEIVVKIVVIHHIDGIGKVEVGGLTQDVLVFVKDGEFSRRSRRILTCVAAFVFADANTDGSAGVPIVAFHVAVVGRDDEIEGSVGMILPRHP